MDDERLRSLLAENDGLLTRRQAGALGLSRATVRWALQTRWQLVLPG